MAYSNTEPSIAHGELDDTLALTSLYRGIKKKSTMILIRLPLKDFHLVKLTCTYQYQQRTTSTDQYKQTPTN